LPASLFVSEPLAPANPAVASRVTVPPLPAAAVYADTGPAVPAADARPTGNPVWAVTPGAEPVAAARAAATAATVVAATAGAVPVADARPATADVPAEARVMSAGAFRNDAQLLVDASVVPS
jgi:hypothetical protein